MQIICPQCNFSKDVPNEKIPPNARTVTCPRCKTRFSLPLREAAGTLNHREAVEKSENTAQPYVSPSALPDREESSQGQPEGTDIPWESASQKGMFVSVVSTILGVIFSPTRFYATMNPAGKTSFPLAFAIITGGGGWLLSIFWEYLFVSGLLNQMQEPWIAWLGTGTIVMFAIFLPILVTISLYFSSAVIHLGLIILRSNTLPFKATFKLTAYAYAPQLFSIIPGLGSLIGALWMIVVTTIGLSTVHTISKTKAFLSLFLVYFIVATVGVVVISLLTLLFNGATVL